MEMFQNKDINTKQLKQLCPISRVVFKALMEESYGPTYPEQVVSFLMEAQEVWKNNHPSKSYAHPGAYYLGRTYQALEEAEIIGPQGEIWNPATLAMPGRLNGHLCRPREFAPICYENTKTFKNLAFCVDRTNELSR